MNEHEWTSSSDAVTMLKYTMEKTSDRKLRLFGCGCCRQVWGMITEDCFRDAIETAERFADGVANKKELAEAKKVSGAALERNGLKGVNGPPYCAIGSAWSTTRNAPTAAMYPLWVFTNGVEREWETALLRDIFGNPFRPITINPEWLTPNVIALAQTIYDERSFDGLPELADTLVNAGCDNQDILDHCRSEGPHVRGCWVVDLALGRA